MTPWQAPRLVPLAPLAASLGGAQEWLTEAGHALGGFTGINPSDQFQFPGAAPAGPS